MDRCYLILKVNVIELLITFYQITEARSETRNELLRFIDHKPIKMLNYPHFLLFVTFLVTQRSLFRRFQIDQGSIPQNTFQ